MFDVFYFGPKPNIFEFEKPADSLEHAAEQSCTRYYWYIYGGNDYTGFDFDYTPVPWESSHVHVFPSQWQRNGGVYLANKHTAHNRMWNWRNEQRVQRAITNEIFWIDKHNGVADFRCKELQKQYPGRVHKTRYYDNMVDTVKRCVAKATTPDIWVISSDNDCASFNFSWHPDDSQEGLLHVFPSQWQKWGETFLINTLHFNEQVQWVDTLEEFGGLNFVQDQQVTCLGDGVDIYYVDHSNAISRHQFDTLQTSNPNIKLTRLAGDYIDTIRRIANVATTEYVWIINSICNYTQFDFGWRPEPWQAEMIHVFPSDSQARGDTFYIHVPSFKKQMVELELLDWFNVINYCTDQCVERFEAKVHYYAHDNLIEEIKSTNFDFPYVTFTNQSDESCYYYPCLWSAKDKEIVSFSRSGATCIVPREIKSHLQAQLYDYPYLKRDVALINDRPLDIVYISNGEPDAEKWYERLRYQLFYSSGRTPESVTRLKRVTNVNGRAAAYKAAAEVSETPWFFAVFAKLEVDAKFDWEWQPDYWQEPKHYIFYARNPVNGLEYGHQAMIAYNKKLVLETTDTGLDFTLSRAHDVVPIMSGTAHFNQDPWMTWRTAFREVLKLRQFMDTDPTLETKYRLNTWQSKAHGAHAEWSLAGARDAIEFYESVNGSQVELMKSFEWDWLRNYFNIRYSAA